MVTVKDKCLLLHHLHFLWRTDNELALKGQLKLLNIEILLIKEIIKAKEIETDWLTDWLWVKWLVGERIIKLKVKWWEWVSLARNWENAIKIQRGKWRKGWSWGRVTYAAGIEGRSVGLKYNKREWELAEVVKRWKWTCTLSLLEPWST